MPLAAKAETAFRDTFNVGRRDWDHVALGAAVCVGLIGASAILTSRTRQAPVPGAKPVRDPWLKAIWPSVFSVTTLAALRVWNAPDGPRRTRALMLWGLTQATTLGLAIWNPGTRRGQLISGLMTAGVTTAYAHAAAGVDQKAASLTAPTGFAGLASLAARTPKTA